MRTRKLTKEQIDEILKNKNVSKCGTSITYTKDFKVMAINQYINEGLSPRKIFRQAGFDLHVIGIKKPEHLVHEWRKIHKTKGIKGFDENRGKNKKRFKKIKEELTDEEKIKRLELEIEYLKKENAFLARLRAKRAE